MNSHLHPIFQQALAPFAPKEDQHQGDTISNLIDTTDRIAFSGRCAVSYENGQSFYLCGKMAATFCKECGTELCLKCAEKCCMETYCEPCLGIHLATHHEWLDAMMAGENGI